ncbi:MAG: efflux transporter outer membrane subunit [Candidatus Hydrogenedens sp.]|nr:efflux transporter outer membrane subunit [Candidatus Hydrogenedens sp.]
MCAACACAAAVGLSSCVTFPPPDRSPADLPLPETYSLYSEAVPDPGPWWLDFHSDDLSGLIDSAIDGNFTIAQAAARIRQADALVQQARSSLLPSVNFGIDADTTRRQVDTGESYALESSTRRLAALSALAGGTSIFTGTASSGLANLRSGLQVSRTRLNGLQTLLEPEPSSLSITSPESYGLGVSASYEVDLWGRVRANAAAAQDTLDASREDAYAAVHSVAGQVALTWLDALEYAQILRVTRDQLETNRTNLELIEVRYRNGLATALDVYQQRQAVADTEAALPQLEARYALLLHTLAVLLGQPPKTDLGLDETAFPQAGALPETGLPADLLAMRPDVRAAGLRLKAADWQVSAAQAQRLPALTLSASMRAGAQNTSLIFDNWIMTLAGSLAGPVFDAGRRKAEVERARAVADERLAAYKQVVLNAVAEVEDALVQIDRQEAYVAALGRQIEAARNAYREALGRYRMGLTDYLPVLTALRNTQSLERAEVEAEHDRMVYRVQLHLALGGGWMQEQLATAKDPDVERTE